MSKTNGTVLGGCGFARTALVSTERPQVSGGTAVLLHPPWTLRLTIQGSRTVACARVDGYRNTILTVSPPLLCKERSTDKMGCWPRRRKSAVTTCKRRSAGGRVPLDLARTRCKNPCKTLIAPTRATR